MAALRNSRQEFRPGKTQQQRRWLAETDPGLRQSPAVELQNDPRGSDVPVVCVRGLAVEGFVGCEERLRQQCGCVRWRAD